MSVSIKICGLTTPDALDVALDAGADMVGFVFFPPSPRNVGFEAARVLGARVRGRAQKVALSVDADDAQLAASIEALAPDLLQLHGQETPERVVAVRARFGLPVMKALPIAERADLSPIRLYAKVADRLLFDARAPREATRPGGLGKRVRLAAAREPRRRRAVHAVGRARRRQRRRGAAHHPRAGRRRLLRRRARARREGSGQDPRLHPRGARGGSRRRRRRNVASRRMTVQQQPNSFRTGPDERGHFGIYGGRFVAETLMPLILELEQAYADAKADPAFQTEMDGHLTALCRPAVAALFRRALTAASRRREDLFQARGAQPHRRAQGEQRARPDHAGAAHGQEAHHRRDRRRHARRRHRDPVRASSASNASSIWARSTSSGRSRTCCA